MKICLIKTSSMGDVIHSLPAITDAQRIIPHLQVDWVVEPAFAEIPRWHSTVDRIIPFAFRTWRKRLFSKQTWQQWHAFKQQLQAENYTAVIDAQGLLKSAFFATRLANGKKYGYDKHSIREPIASLFYDQCYSIPYQQHAVERIRQLFAQSLGYTTSDSKGDYGIAEKLQATFAKSNPIATACTPYIVAVHATTRADKHWSEASWAKLFEYCGQAGIAVRLPWGNSTEKARALRLAEHSSHIQVLPKLTLSQLAEQILGATAVVSVDTGLSHLTAALNKPNVILYGSTDPTLIGAYGQHQYHLHANGMQNLSPEQVWAMLQEVVEYG